MGFFKAGLVAAALVMMTGAQAYGAQAEQRMLIGAFVIAPCVIDSAHVTCPGAQSAEIHVGLVDPSRDRPTVRATSAPGPAVAPGAASIRQIDIIF